MNNLGSMLTENNNYKCELAVYEMAIHRLFYEVMIRRSETSVNEILLSSAIAIRDKHIESYNAIMAGQSVTDFDDVSTLKFVEIYNNLVVKYGGQSRDPHQPEGEHT
tara:strand:- start:405 stop:725 length:321 start_codon:yes stop_codon:yes gene_type:complete